MIVSFAILEGFRHEIERKVFTFGAHLHVIRYDDNNSVEGSPMPGSLVRDDLQRAPQVDQIHAFARKTAIIKTRTEVQGVVVGRSEGLREGADGAEPGSGPVHPFQRGWVAVE